MQLLTVTHIKEAVERITHQARIKVNRVSWPVIEIEVPFHCVKKVRSLQECCGIEIKLTVKRLSLVDHFTLDKIVIDKSM